jgi:hypothetical protein
VGDDRPVRSRTPFLLLATLVLTAACGGGGGSSDIKAADELFVATPVVSPDAGGTSATLTVSTKLKVACRVYWGTTKAATDGSATDPDMASTGPHTTHHAIMTGLKPDTTYYYRVAGNDPGGQKYAADLGTFHTAAALTKPGVTITSAARVAGVSSQYSDAYSGANAIDGNAGTEWASAGDGDKAWIKLDFDSIRSLAGIGFRTRSMSDGTSIMKSITVQGDDGKVFGPFPVGAGLTIIPLSLTTKTLKISAAKTTGGNTGATEIEVYAKQP